MNPRRPVVWARHHRRLAVVAGVLLACVAIGAPIVFLAARPGRTGGTAVAASGVVGEIDAEPDMRSWVYPGANPQSWWCEMPDCTPDFDVGGQGPMPTIDAELEAIRDLGARYAGIGVPWPLIETARGAYDWGRLDAIVAAASRAEVVLEPELDGTPQWAGGGPQLADPPSSVADWTGFVTALTQRYRKDFPDIEIWNEPDGGQALSCTGPSCEQIYVNELLNPAYAAIKAVDPSIRVVMAGSANDAGACCAYLSAVLADGARFDVATFHNYTGTWASEASQYRSILDQNGHRGEQLWMTEFGVNSTIGDQSAALRQVFAGALPIQVAGWYNLRDTDAWSCCPPADLARGHWGLLDADFSPKPSFSTLQALLAGKGSPAAPAAGFVGAVTATLSGGPAA